jgi:hypothetical protein
VRTRQRFASELAQDEPMPRHFSPCSRTAPVVDGELPSTDLPADLERALSAPFVQHERYGTCCSTLAFVGHDGRTRVHERRFDATGAQAGAEPFRVRRRASMRRVTWPDTLRRAAHALVVVLMLAWGRRRGCPRIVINIEGVDRPIEDNIRGFSLGRYTERDDLTDAQVRASPTGPWTRQRTRCGHLVSTSRRSEPHQPRRRSLIVRLKVKPGEP